MKKNSFWRCAVLCVFVLPFLAEARQEKENDEPIVAEQIKQASAVLGLHFTDAEIDSLLGGVTRNRERFRRLRARLIDNAVPPALVFNPLPLGFELDRRQQPLELSPPGKLERPINLNDLAFWSVRDLGELLRTRKITSGELTRMYLARLKKYGPQLECVVTLTDSLALEQARRADAEIAAGHYRGPLHGIPYGLKDLFAVKGYKTTWGAMPYKDQVIDEDATVVRKLEAAGAVLVAKLTLGALAWGDVWFGGKTRNPWNLEQGSSGSSAGPAAATAAGLVGFAIGTETWGSIVSPSTRCGVTGLRPTFGRVSRAGAMALSWSMDKIGPICRTVEGCAIVFDAIRGADGTDPSVIEASFNYRAKTDLGGLRIGYLRKLFERVYGNKERDTAVLETLRRRGARLVPIGLPDLPVRALSFILNAEAAAAFDELTLSGRDDLMVRQIKNAWPNAFRTSRFIPAVEYIQANRVRFQLIQNMQKMMDTLDVYIAPSFGGANLLLTNLTGHPCVVVPNGFNEKGSPTSISFIGALFNEAAALAVAKAFQDATPWHLRHPPDFQ